MYRTIQLVLLITLYFFNSVGAFGQKFHCNGKLFNVSEFECDSIASFENRYVFSQAVNSIKNSKYPLEIRIYSIGFSIDHVSLQILQKDEDSTIYSKSEIVVGNAAPMWEGYNEFYRNGKFAGRKKTTTKDVKFNCKQINDLVKYRLFSMKSSNRAEFKDKADGKYYYDAGGLYIFEIKVNSNFRNFQYTVDQNSIDMIAGRSKNIDNIIEIFNNF